MEITTEDIAMIQAALAQHAAMSMQFCYKFIHTDPTKAEAFRKDAKRCLELSTAISKEAYFLAKGIV